MHALIEAIEDGEKKKILCFFSEKDAKRFKKFVNTYMMESGAGNGYGAYWVYINADIVQCDKVPGFSSNEIKTNLLLSMLTDILVARTADEHPGSKGMELIVGQRDKAITFRLAGKLPPRQRPEAGDMFRAVSRHSKTGRFEGRVVKDLGNTLEVISCWDEGDDGQPKSDAKIIRVKVSHVMKINDWMKKHREERAML